MFPGDTFGFAVHKTWEFDEDFPVRSTFAWAVICGYPFSLLRILKLIGITERVDSYWILVLPRMAMCLLSLITDAAG